MHLIDWLIVIGLNAAIIGYGFYLARGTHSSSDWFLGRRALPWWGIGLSMFATNVDSADIVSVAGKTYAEGLHILSVYAIGSWVGGMLAAFLVVPAIYRAGFYTNAEYLEARFGLSMRILSALIQIQYRTIMLGLMIYALFLLLQGLSVMSAVQSLVVGETAGNSDNLSTALSWALIVGLVIFSGFYTAWGGLKAVVWTDALQGIVIFVGGAVIFCSVAAAVGGWSGAEEKLLARDAENAAAGQTTNLAGLLHISSYDGGVDLPVSEGTSSEGTNTDASAARRSSPYAFQLGDFSMNLGPLVVVLAWTIIGAGYWSVNHTQTMRLMGARSLWDMKMAAVVGVALSLPVLLACTFLGVFGRALPEGAGLEQADQIYPLLANTFLGVGLKGLVVAAIVSAAVSTFDSMGSALSAVFTRDIYARLLYAGGDDQHYVRVGRIATIGVLQLGFLYLPFIMLQKNMLDAFTTLIPVFVTPLFTVYVMGVLLPVHRRSGLIGLGVGAAYGVFALYCREAGKFELLPDATGVPVWMFDRWIALLWSLLFTMAGMLAVTLCLGWQQQGDLLRVQNTGWLARSRESLPPLRESPFAGDVPWWARPSLYAGLLGLFCFWMVFVWLW
ncbi:sodium:solute symporter family transporter [Lignipirellula cremea]|uniref:Sodium/glucose cotransporter n=1 Tax=Lignipirellula cremea TaxID=2528010 RepID=A0A518DZ41_9BACT|nr:hypothetical protein [Lignipirellula cremea]QDU97071.1 Sodium/glucose cotransporter [Lignipirellula cremea]